MYKHKIVQGLDDLIQQFGGGGKDPMMKALWWGIKGQIPLMLKSLDDSPSAVAEIEKKMREMLDVPAVVEVEASISPKEIAKLPIPGAKEIAMLSSEPTTGYLTESEQETELKESLGEVSAEITPIPDEKADGDKEK